MRFAFKMNHFGRRTRLFFNHCLGGQSDTMIQNERETLYNEQQANGG
jgi:hypothetical protein